MTECPRDYRFPSWTQLWKTVAPRPYTVTAWIKGLALWRGHLAKQVTEAPGYQPARAYIMQEFESKPLHWALKITGNPSL